MPLAADYPLLEIFWTIALIALWAVWIWIVVAMLIDVWRRVDHGGGSKALWTLFVIFVPLLGVLVYVIARPNDIGPMGADNASRNNEGDASEQLTRLAALRDKGELTEDEFQKYKKQLLA